VLPKSRHLPRFKSSLHFPYRPCPCSAEDYIVREPRAAGDTRTMFKYLGRATATHPWLVCLAWVIVAGVVSIAAPKWDERAADDDIRFLPARCDSVKGHQLLEQAFPQDVFASRLIVAVERGDAPLTASDFALVDDLAADLQRLREDDSSLQISRI